MSPELSHILTDVRDIISRGWTQRELARDKLGGPVNIFASCATCWCLEGATILVTDKHSSTSEVVNDVYRVLSEKIREIDSNYRGFHSSRACITNWNDRLGRTKQEVLNLLTSVII